MLLSVEVVGIESSGTAGGMVGDRETASIRNPVEAEKRHGHSLSSTTTAIT
jgi:hypothetical protein